MRDPDKFRGCVLGGAAGDALGYEVEFMGEEAIFHRFGPDGIPEYALTHGAALISDDTQMTLFTANGLLACTAREKTKEDRASYVRHILTMYQCWFKTQTRKFPIRAERLESWLLNLPELFSLRAPGGTCMAALRSGVAGTIEKPINTSKGCGGVMRVAPIGLYFCDSSWTFEESNLLAAQAAALTHGHDLGYIPAAALAHIIRAIVEKGLPLENAVDESLGAMKKLFGQKPHFQEFDAIMREAVRLAGTETDDLDAIHILGEGWVGEEALAIAVYCSLKYPNDFDRALRVSVNHKGDSDSTGAVTGNILGASLGFRALPQKYKDHLELYDRILEIADDLFTDCQNSEVWERKYVTATYPNP